MILLKIFPEKLVRLKGLEKTSSSVFLRVLSMNSDKVGLSEKSNLDIKGRVFSEKVIKGLVPVYHAYVT